MGEWRGNLGRGMTSTIYYDPRWGGLDLRLTRCSKINGLRLVVSSSTPRSEKMAMLKVSHDGKKWVGLSPERGPRTLAKEARVRRVRGRISA